MFIKLKQALCEHSYRISAEDAYMSVGDKYHKIKSTQMTLICGKCGKRVKIYDKHKYYLGELKNK